MKKIFSSLTLACVMALPIATFAQDQMKSGKKSKKAAKKDQMKKDSMKHDSMQDNMKQDDMKKHETKKN